MSLTDEHRFVLSRRELLLAATGAVVIPALAACSSGDAEQDAARALRRPAASLTGTAAVAMQDLVRQATLAPSSHNTQCRRFHLAEGAIDIVPDFTRRCPAVDPDDHHRFASLGCATANLVHAALAVGLHADPRFDHSGDGRISVQLSPTQQRITPLYAAIAGRQCTRGDVDGQPISTGDLRLLEQAGTGDGVSVRLAMVCTPVQAAIPPCHAGWLVR